jgi:hypothetical protein
MPILYSVAIVIGHALRVVAKSLAYISDLLDRAATQPDSAFLLKELQLQLQDSLAQRDRDGD